MKSPTRTSSAWPALALLALLAVPATATGQAASPDEPPPSMQTQAQQLLTPMPEVDLSPLEPAVAKQIASMLAEIDQLLGNPAANAGQFALSYGELGQVLHAYGLTSAAAVAYSNARVAAPKEFRWAYYLGVLHQTEGRLDEAAEVLDKALGLDPRHLPAMVRRGEIEIARARPEDAMPYLERALTQDPTSAATLAALGQVALSRRDYRTAIEHLQSALAALPEANRLHYPLALAYRGLGDEDKARHHLALNGPVGARPNDPLIDELEALKRGERVHLVRGGTAFRAGRFAEAAEAFRIAVEANPESVSARVNLATALAALGQVGEAEGELARAIELDPENPTSRFNLGLLMAQRGEVAGAIGHLRSAARLAPEDAVVRLQLARTLAAAGLSAEALLHYQAAVGAAPEDPQPRLGEAQMLVRQERYAEAAERLDDLLDVVPGYGPAIQSLARLLAASPDAAVRNGERALELASLVFDAQPTAGSARAMAEAHGELGNCDEAAQWQERASELARQAGNEEAASALANEGERYRAGPPCRPPLADSENAASSTGS